VNDTPIGLTSNGVLRPGEQVLTPYMALGALWLAQSKVQWDNLENTH